MTLTFQQVEPISDEHHDKIIAAFNMFFIDRGGQIDGYGFGNGYGNGYGKCPEAWRVE